jgi:hypothetical protein
VRCKGHASIRCASNVHLNVRYGGIERRALTSSDPGRYLSQDYRSGVDEFEQEATFELSSVADELVEIVKHLTAPLFQLFDFFQLGDDIYKEIVDRFVQGKVT